MTCPSDPAATGVPGSWESELWAALGELPLKQRQTVAYHHLAGLPYAEVAEILGGTSQAARRAAADGIAALRKTYLKGAAR
ncbi:MAG: sigma factor-like helix-turn-helix DNA-binding protein [Geodermatophilaceae bacterium]